MGYEDAKVCGPATLGMPSVVNELRRRAIQLHEQAVRLEKLAEFAECAPQDIKEALREVLIMSR